MKRATYYKAKANTAFAIFAFGKSGTHPDLLQIYTNNI